MPGKLEELKEKEKSLYEVYQQKKTISNQACDDWYIVRKELEKALNEERINKLVEERLAQVTK